ncbi:MAG: T9SS type A sorting domain-containing protein [Bacteroidota bacterium]
MKFSYSMIAAFFIIILIATCTGSFARINGENNPQQKVLKSIGVKSIENPAGSAASARILSTSLKHAAISVDSGATTDLSIDSGVVVTLTNGVIVSLDGNFTNAGTFTADSGTTIELYGSGSQAVTGPTTFDNLTISGGGTVTLASSITVNDSLTILNGNINTGSDTVYFGSNGTVNGESVGGQIIGPDNTILPHFKIFNVHITNKWNLLSIPMDASDLRKTVLYPTAVSSAYIYLGGYQVQDTLTTGEGFWIKFGAIQTAVISGNGLVDDSINVKAGWNIIGSISTPVLTSSIVPVGTTINSRFFGYSGGYTMEDTLNAGKGYWVKVGTDGKLYLTSGTTTATAASKLVREDPFSRMNKLYITDADGISETLYFGKTSEISKPPDYFALPPVPPEGNFDVRYSTDRMAETVADNVSKSIPIIFSSAKYPVTLSWELVNDLHSSLKVNGALVAMTKTGSTKITNEKADIQLSINSTPSLPQEYGLDQNYPNPFNPSTSIHYALPVSSSVRLRVYNILGQLVETLVDGVVGAGYQYVEWHAENKPSGVYFYSLDAASEGNPVKTFRQIHKMLLIK